MNQFLDNSLQGLFGSMFAVIDQVSQAHDAIQRVKFVCGKGGFGFVSGLQYNGSRKLVSFCFSMICAEKI